MSRALIDDLDEQFGEPSKAPLARARLPSLPGTTSLKSDTLRTRELPMGVRTKGRRKLDIDGRRYVWWVQEDRDGAGPVLHVVSEDKRLIVMYALWQPVGEDYVVVLGSEFAGAETGGCWERFRSPSWIERGAVSPRTVRGLIEWCQSDAEPRARAAVGSL